MIQKKAIGLIEEVLRTIRALPEEKALQVNGLINSIASFDVITDLDLSSQQGHFHPHLAVIHNIITRGLPTFTSVNIEEKICKAFGKTVEIRNEILGEFSYSFAFSDDFYEQIFDALHLIDPRLYLSQDGYNTTLLGSDFESTFIFKYLTDDDQYLRQLLYPQRLFTSIVDPSRSSNHFGQRVDFSIEIPYLQKTKSIDHFGNPREAQKRTGYIIEIDGPQHRQAIIEDNNRDADAKEALWSVLRVSSGNVQIDINTALTTLKNNPYLKKCKELSRRPLTVEWKNFLQIVLSPVGISRLQSVFVDYLLSHTELLDRNKKLKIAVIEQDVPCGSLAFDDLIKLVTNLQNLSNDNFEFPVIELDIYSSPEFIDSRLHINNDFGELKRIEDFPSLNYDYDLVIDISLLRRSLIEKNPSYNNYILIRSSHFTEHDNQRIIYTSKSISYKSLVKKLQNDTYDLIQENVKILEIFLKDIFRKLSFLDGQLPILNRALQNLSVIGLLPTGGGKSLTYQLASLLQPGIVLVVDPIKSLMQDQYQNLLDAGIDTAIFINSTLTTTERKINTAKFSSGEIMFCFVSPERLIIKEFRDALEGMNQRNIYFTYCVIDEVHCVSEWGHDFRTAYLSLGKNAVDYCKAGSGKPIPIFGLTATASFDVLADVERELSYKNNIGLDAIVRRENTIRDEIQYRIIESEGEFKTAMPFSVNGVTFENAGPLKSKEQSRYNNSYIEKDVNYWKVRELVGVAKRSNINELIYTVPHDLSLRFNDEELKTVLDQSFSKFLEEKDIAELSTKYNIASDKIDLLKEAFIKDQLERVKISNLDLEEFYNEKCQNASIIFCPHKAWYSGVTDKYKWQKYSANDTDDQGNVIHRKGDFVRDKNGNKIPIPLSERKGIADSLTDPRLKIGTFIGSGGENEKEEKTAQEESFENQNAFINNNLNVMVATKAFGMGINKRNIRCTMHLNMPSSLEGFIQEGGRAGRDRKMAVNYILINKQRFSVWDINARNRLILVNKKYNYISNSDLERIIEILNQIKDKYFFREHFELIIRRLCESNNIPNISSIIESIPVIYPDRDIIKYFHNRSFKGKEKEKAILFELRDRITYPNIPRLKILEEKIKEELLIDELTISFGKSDIIFFNAGYQNTFGSLNLYNLHPVTKIAKGYDPGISTQVLQMAVDYFKENYLGPNENTSRKNWLKETQLLEPASGIERWVLDETVPLGKDNDFKVHFENLYANPLEYHNRLVQFWKTISDENNLNLNLNYLDDCIPEEENIEQYINNIENTFNISINDLLTDNQLNSLKIRFYCIRKKEDTDKAIYRLKSIGLIDDYTIDYNNKMFYIKAVKKNTSEYVDSLYEFIKRYYSEGKAKREIENIDQTDERFTIRNCINFLTDFIYNEIEKKRRVAADDMYTACQEGSGDNNLGFKEFVYTYFNSKFARQPYEVNGTDYSLLSEENTDNGKLHSFDIVWKFIDAVNGEVDGSQVDNLKHLRGACLRILRSNPDNASLNLLKAYALFILAGNNEVLFSEASDSYFKGFNEFRSFYVEFTTEQFNLMIEKYKNLVLEHANNIRVKETIEKLTRLLYIQLTANRFHQFKTKFIEDYGR